MLMKIMEAAVDFVRVAAMSLITNPELYIYYRKNMRVVDIDNSNTSRV